MAGRAVCSVVFALALAGSWLHAAQGIETALTNQDVEKMLDAGLAESTIRLVIELARGRGAVDFDASPEELIRLKQRGAGAAILEAMLEAESLKRARPAPSDVVPGLPERRGLYYREDGGRWIPVAASLVWPDMRSRWRWTSEFQDRIYVLAGRQAYVEASQARPAFHLRDPAPEGEWVLFRLRRRGSARQLRIRMADAFAYGPGHPFRGSAHGGVEVSTLAPDVHVLRPETNLEPGEYLLVKLSPGQRWIPAGYAFGVALESKR
jgi:hypothetical protein